MIKKKCTRCENVFEFPESYLDLDRIDPCDICCTELLYKSFPLKVHCDYPVVISWEKIKKSNRIGAIKFCSKCHKIVEAISIPFNFEEKEDSVNE